MADEQQLFATIARLEAALAALSAAPDAGAAADAEQAEMLNAAAAELEAAREATRVAEAARATAEARVAELEAELAAQPEPAAAASDDDAIRMRNALEAMSKAADDLRGGAGDADATLEAEVEALRAARAMDLAEMRAILDELEPIMERAHA